MINNERPIIICTPPTPTPAPARAPAPYHPFGRNELLRSLLPRSGYDYSMFHLVHPDGINHENYLAIDPEHANWLITILFENSGGIDPHGYGYDRQISAYLQDVVQNGLTTLFNALYDVATEVDFSECELLGTDTDKAGAGYLSPFWEKVVTHPKYSGAWFHVDASPPGQQEEQNKPIRTLGGAKWKVPKSWTGYLRITPPVTRARGRGLTEPYLCSMSHPIPQQVHYLPSGAHPGPGYKPITTIETVHDLSSQSTVEALTKACIALHSLTALILDAREYVIERPGRFPSSNLPSSDPLVLAIDQFRSYLESLDCFWEEPIQQAFYSYHATLFRLSLPVAGGLFGGNGMTLCQLKPVHVSRDTGKIVDETVMVASVSSAGSSDVEENGDDDDERLLSDTESDYACSSFSGSSPAKKLRRCA
ncbi:hypothetical protein B0T20DRAFT_456652 [Sordaria brevicollis]|uniref:Uncharacterized protein n=1 Tax=Sordaria brevicollis TaxID=83679 RepID=A0AAE0P178_SORBR|nr:hypothetical protein B0T20DRAFT_456652 [Sordaria brevicollis]